MASQVHKGVCVGVGDILGVGVNVNRWAGVVIFVVAAVIATVLVLTPHDMSEIPTN